jgi:hypothetical protein
MKVFILAAFFVGLVSCGDFMLESTADIFAKWSKFKAMETCFGDEVRPLMTSLQFCISRVD